MSKARGPKLLKFTPDELVQLITARLDAIDDDNAFKKIETLMSLAVDLAIQFGASTTMHDELVARNLKRILSGGRRHILHLAPRASQEMQEQILTALCTERFGTRKVAPLIAYAKDILHRDLTLPECEQIKHWFQSCPNVCEQIERAEFLKYIKETFPEKSAEFIDHFKKEDRFWNGVGRLL